MLLRLLLLACLGTGPVLAKQAFFGTVTIVTDGDTLWVAPAQGGAVRKLRIDGLDAPEICQAGGETARAVLMDAALHKRVWVEVRRLDIYGRGLAKVWLDRNDLGAYLVSQGQAWSYRGRGSAGPYAAQEALARQARRGVFALSRPENPQKFRQRHGTCHVPSS